MQSALLELPSLKIVQNNRPLRSILILDLLHAIMNKPFHLIRDRLKPRLVRPLVIGILSTVSLVSGLIPSFQVDLLDRTATVAISNSAYAQANAITSQEVQNYARSVLAIEPIRQETYNQIKQIIGNRDVPAIACHQPNSLNNLNRNIREIAVNYCNQSIAIVEQNDLTIGRFNVITTSQQSDPELQQRIQEELIRLQRSR
jgi:hypothetical protein